MGREQEKGKQQREAEGDREKEEGKAALPSP